MFKINDHVKLINSMDERNQSITGRIVSIYVFTHGRRYTVQLDRPDYNKKPVVYFYHCQENEMEKLQ